MLASIATRTIRVMLTTFRDGLQSSFGGKTRLKDILPAMEFASKEAHIRHFEFGGGARFQAPYFYLGEDPFFCQDEMRRAVGPDADLQILTRSVSGVTLTTQPLAALRLQARLMARHGATFDRNFDYMNDVDNLERTGAPIVAAGLHHQLAVAMMGLPFDDETVHTPAFYVGIVKKLLDRGARFDSVCMKDASGTTDPKTCYETAKGLRRILPPEVPLWQHTHDTASMAVSCYLAGIEGGVDGIDLSVRPLGSGTVQPDVRSMWHALKGTGFQLDIDVTKMAELERILNDGMVEYEFDPVTTTADARVVNFPMPGGAIGPNVHMMKEAGILAKYGEVLAEFRRGDRHPVPAAGDLPWRRGTHRLPPAARPADHLRARGGRAVRDLHIGYLGMVAVRFHDQGGRIDRHHRRGGRPDDHLSRQPPRAPAARSGRSRGLQLQSLVPIIQPPVMRLLTTKAEREIPIPPARDVSHAAVIVFPIMTAMLASLFIPDCAPLVGLLMFGNLLRETGVTDRLWKTAEGALINIATIFLGLVVGATMNGNGFIVPKTLGILVLGAVAFIFSTAGGVAFAKLMNLVLPRDWRINPCIGAAGVSAVR